MQPGPSAENPECTARHRRSRFCRSLVEKGCGPRSRGTSDGGSLSTARPDEADPDQRHLPRPDRRIGLNRVLTFPVYGTKPDQFASTHQVCADRGSRAPTGLHAFSDLCVNEPLPGSSVAPPGSAWIHRPLDDSISEDSTCTGRNRHGTAGFGHVVATVLISTHPGLWPRPRLILLRFAAPRMGTSVLARTFWSAFSRS